MAACVSAVMVQPSVGTCHVGQQYDILFKAGVGSFDATQSSSASNVNLV